MTEEDKRYRVVDDSGTVFGKDLSLFKAEVALCRCCNEDIEGYSRRIILGRVIAPVIQKALCLKCFSKSDFLCLCRDK